MDRYHWNIPGLCEMRWKNFGEMSSDDRHKVYFSGEEDRHEYGVGFCRICFSKVRYRRPVFRPSVRLSVHNLRRPIKSIQTTYSLKPLHPWILNFICSMIRLQSFRIVKFSRVENSRWPPLLKIAKLLKSPFSPERLGIFGWNLVSNFSRTLMLIDIKIKKFCGGIRSQWPFENLRRP